MSVEVTRGDITQIRCDAIVNPANSLGYMGGGVAGAIKRTGGSVIEKEVLEKAPIAVGDAVATTAGSLPCQYVIHAPTMERPAMKINVENVRKATEAALQVAERLGLKCVAIPGMGTGVGGVSPDDAADAMADVIKSFEERFEKIIFVDRNEEMIEAFKRYLSKKQ
ncbi:MAG: macro domain-containing protein [Thermoplasmata archaeon]|nr:MAG: macro domain-containing protein [Thermoplasmata archaeon]RLF34953.1 MAG: macro domain-containing protein [Thermoplasmata archaeon]